MSFPQIQLSHNAPQEHMPPPIGEPWERFSMRDLLTIIFKYKVLVFSVFAVTVIGTLLALWIRPPKYEVEARVLIKYGRDTSNNPRSSLSPGTNRMLTRRVEVYRQARLGVERTPEVEKFFTDEAAQYEGRLKQSEAELSALKAKSQAGSLPDQIGMQARIIAETQRMLDETVNRLAEAQAQVALLQRQVTDEKPTTLLEQVEGRNALLDQLNDKKANLQLRRQELLAKYTDDDVHVKDIDQQVAAVSQMIADADQAVQSSRTTGENGVYVDLRKQLAAVLRARDASMARYKNEQSELARYRPKLAELQSLEPTYN